MIDLSIFSDFPRFGFAGEVTVPIVEFKNIVITPGMWAVWKEEEPFRIEAIRINPTLRFWDGKSWAHAAQCRLIQNGTIDP